MSDQSLAKVDDVIQHGEVVPANVVRLRDRVTTSPDECWVRSDVEPMSFQYLRADGTHGASALVVSLQGYPTWWPMTVVEVDPEPQPAEAANLVPDDEALRAIGEDRAVLWLEDLNAAIDRLWPGAGWTPGDSAGPVVLSLPQVPDGAVALVGIESGQRWEPLGTAWWNDEKRVQRYLSDVLREEGSVTVEFARPREPRVWPKLNTLDPADDDPTTVDVEGRGRWVWDNGRGLYGDGIGDWCSLRELQHLGEVREVLTS